VDKSEIKRIRKTLKLSQEAFARRLGVSWISVQRWESGDGEAHINRENIDKIIKLGGEEK
jgi:DNA-binding transcriptional regulator YiaG